jgi:hypothetical protein|tara:strand:- start:316 stop:534 length:219 start_codon:yes stop_codon:yes gene_type:complete
MELEQLVMVALILVIVYMLSQMSQQQQSAKTDSVVYLQAPYFGYNFGQGPLWRGPRPGRRRWRRRGRRRFWF